MLKGGWYEKSASDLTLTEVTREKKEVECNDDHLSIVLIAN